MDKQIEEMAKTICGGGHIDYERCGDCFGEEDDFCGCIGLAEKFYNAGYRKIPENAVVLTREEYERLGLFEETIQEYGTVNGQLALIKERKVLKKLPTDITDYIREQARKETAEKFAERLKARLEERKKICLERWKRYEKERETDLASYWNGKENEIHCVKADIYEICKEITEGKV